MKKFILTIICLFIFLFVVLIILHIPWVNTDPYRRYPEMKQWCFYHHLSFYIYRSSQNKQELIFDTNYKSISSMDVTVDNTTLAYSVRRIGIADDINPGVSLLDIKKRSFEKIYAAEGCDNVSWSPSGKLLLFDPKDTGKHLILYKKDTDTFTTLSFSVSFDGKATWIDENNVLLSCVSGKIYRINLMHGTVEYLFDGSDPIYIGGDNIMFCHAPRVSGHNRYFISNIQGTGKFYAFSSISSPIISPNRKLLIYQKQANPTLLSQFLYRDSYWLFLYDLKKRKTIMPIEIYAGPCWVRNISNSEKISTTATTP